MNEQIETLLGAARYLHECQAELQAAKTFGRQAALAVLESEASFDLPEATLLRVRNAAESFLEACE